MGAGGSLSEYFFRYVFVLTYFEKKTFHSFDISSPNITSSAIEVQVSPIPDGFSVYHHSFFKGTQIVRAKMTSLDTINSHMRA